MMTLINKRVSTVLHDLQYSPVMLIKVLITVVGSGTLGRSVKPLQVILKPSSIGLKKIAVECQLVGNFLNMAH